MMGKTDQNELPKKAADSVDILEQSKFLLKINSLRRCVVKIVFQTSG